MISCMNGGSTRSLSERVYSARWKMLGHVLRYDEDNPALLALKFCIFTEERSSGFKGRRGAPRMNLLNIFFNDLPYRKKT